MNCSICNLPTANVVGSVLPQCVCGWQKPSTPSTKREWVGLTSEDMKDERTHSLDFIHGARWAENKLKERNT